VPVRDERLIRYHEGPTRTRLHTPFSTSATFSSVYSLPSARPATTGAPPPCSLSARTVATITARLGFRPEERHLRFTNFSRPMSAPNPALVEGQVSLPRSRRLTVDA
jgi:hypothetical protein